MSATPVWALDGKRAKRREAMLQAALALFVEKGFDATTLGNIVKRSEGSLATLYELFENKSGILRALVTERSVNIGGALDRAMSATDPYPEVLRGVAEEMLDRLLDPNYVGLFRVVSAQCAAHPDLGRQIYDNGPLVCQAKGAEFLAAQMNAGTLYVEDPSAASRMLFQMVCGHFHMQMMFGLEVKLSKKQRSKHLDYVLPAFIKSHAPQHRVNDNSRQV